MIKKLLSILLIIILCGCSNRISLDEMLKYQGYSDEEIAIINKYDLDDTRVFYSSYNEELVSIISDKRFVENKLPIYLMYYKDFDLDLLFKLVNSGFLTKYNLEYVKTITTNNYFVPKNIDKYMDYAKNFKDVKDLISYVNVGAYKKDYIDFARSDTSEPLKVLGNKWNYLGKYEPTDLITINKKHGLAKYDQQLRKEVYEAFIKMYDAAKEDNINMYITSAYRSYDYQVKIYYGYLLRDFQEIVDTYSARPGYSDHQTGNAVDILSYGYNFDTFETSEAFKWLDKNAYKYGFILRFPKGKEELTGYMYESWHYRYVGTDVAKFIHNNELTYEEYYACFIDNK